MGLQLRISVRLLAGRYHGNDWPPSPARLFQALVAGANAGCRVLDWPKTRNALAWLEELEPPAIIAPDVTKGVAYTTYVPNNDSDNSSDLLKDGKRIPSVYEQLCQGLPLALAIRTRRLTAEKSIQPRLLDQEAPTIASELPAVHYLWPLPAPLSPDDQAQADQICRLARNLLALGWGLDVAIGDGHVVSETAPVPAGHQYVPSWSGRSPSVKTPGAGYLDDLERAYGAFRGRTLGAAADPDTRPRAYRPVPYQLAGYTSARAAVHFDLLDDQGEDRRSFRWEHGMLVAAWMRHAARERFLAEGWEQSRVDAYISGHTATGDENHRLSYVPLPSIGHQHSDGHHRRALVVLPFNDACAEETLAILYRMAGDPLKALGRDTPVAWLADGKRDSVVMRYLRECSEWLSVTPVVLHGRDHDGGRFSPRKAEKLLLQAFTESGYPADLIEEFSYQPSPLWTGPGAARQAAVPKHLGKWPRYHVRVQFRHPVAGPILVGIGRHYGLGVFASTPPAAGD